VRPIAEFPSAAARGLRGVFTDIDDTLTTSGKLSAQAYEAMWRLQAAGLMVIPITGRPAGWCDLIARQWPVDGVVGENGALALYEKDGLLRELLHPDVRGPEARVRLDRLRDEVLAEVVGARVAKDQPYRRFDLAIDFREEPPDLGLSAARNIKTIFERSGAHAKISSIHVNGWFGEYDKLRMTELFMREVYNVDLATDRERYVFVGDSPNDEPMFAYFPHAIAVANIRDFLSELRHHPRWLSQGRGGQGFAEIAAVLLTARR
jgi:1,2-diacylglycerol 3-alpha-glucosyltransferase